MLIRQYYFIVSMYTHAQSQIHPGRKQCENNYLKKLLFNVVVVVVVVAAAVASSFKDVLHQVSSSLIGQAFLSSGCCQSFRSIPTLIVRGRD